MRAGARSVGILLLGLSFAVGGLAGMAVEEGLGLDWFDFLDEDRDPEEVLLSDLGLTAAQRDRVEEILDRREERLEAYWRTRLPEIQSVVDSSYAEVRAVLTPAQVPAFDRRVRELRGRMPGEDAD